MATTKVGVLYNPNSRNGLKWYNRQAPGLDPSVLALGTETPAHIPGALTRMAQAGVTHLAVVGGDGTLDAVLTALRNNQPFTHEPVIGLFNAGTTNMTFKDVGFKTLTRRPLERFVRGAHTGRLRLKQHQPLWVHSESLQAPQVGFFLGIGAVPRAIHHTRQTYHEKGITNGVSEGAMLLGAVWRLMRRDDIEHDELLRPITCQVKTPHNQKEVEMVLLTVTSLEKLLVGLRPYRENQPSLSVMGIFHPYTNLMRQMPALLFGTRELPLENSDNITATQQDKCELAFDGEWTLDGEMFQATKGAPVRIHLASPITFAVGADT